MFQKLVNWLTMINQWSGRHKVMRAYWWENALVLFAIICVALAVLVSMIKWYRGYRQDKREREDDGRWNA